MSTTLLKKAQASIRASLSASAASIVAVGLTAGMAPRDAQAWGSDYESLGRTLGYELGHAAGGGSGFSPAARIASSIGAALGGQIGKPFDAASADQRRLEEAQRQGREQAARDAAYDLERRRLDPSYSPHVRYGDMAARAERSQDRARSIATNLESINQMNARLVREYEQRNARNGAAR